MSDKKTTKYSETWDNYVTESFPRIQEGTARKKADLHSWQVLNTSDDYYTWPGDEWGDAKSVQEILETCVFDYMNEAPSALCELGSGAGRFTEAVFQKYSTAKITCFDVSGEFLEQLNKRFAVERDEARLNTCLIEPDPAQMYQELADASLIRKIDCFYSFDAMVHVELHTLVMYFAIAAETLKPGGLLAMNVADATSESGFLKLINNAPGVFRLGGDAGPQFQFTSPDAIALVLKRFGFSVEFHDCNGRDLFFSARLLDPHAARQQFSKSGSKWWNKV